MEKMSSLYHTMCVPIVQKRVKSAAVDLYNSKPVAENIYDDNTDSDVDEHNSD